jgi:DnaJ-class molecular chaperone
MFHCSQCGCSADLHAVDAEWLAAAEAKRAADEAAAARRTAAAASAASAEQSAEAAAYAELGLPLGADARSVARAYKKLALRLHPDKQAQAAAAGGGPAAGAAAVQERFHRVAAAYRLLSERGGKGGRAAR